MRRYTLVCDDDTARRVEGLAAEYDLTEQEVLEQLVGVGLEELD
ncbi:CopG family transcriptional regulator [Natronomonas marina]|nr:CopG family transcriptional regulator [Natronomonas marina]